MATMMAQAVDDIFTGVTRARWNGEYYGVEWPVGCTMTAANARFFGVNLLEYMPLSLIHI